MRQFILILFLFLEIGNTFCQDRYYCNIPRKAQPKYEINLNNSVRYNTDTINFKIESLALLRPKKSWHIDKLSLLKIVNDTIYSMGNKRNLLLFHMNGNPIRKVDLNKIDKNLEVTGAEFYNDTLYLVDNELLFLLKFTKEGIFISKTPLNFNFEDFQINKNGIYFISKHRNEKRKKSVRITLFDFNLNLLEQYFITDTRDNSELRPKFVAKEDSEILFLMTKCSQIYQLGKDRVSLYLQANGEDYLADYSRTNELHSISGYTLKEGDSIALRTRYYFHDGKLKDGVHIKAYSPIDLSILFWGSRVYEDSYICCINLLNNNFLKNILEMKWEEHHKYIKDDLLELLKEVDENYKFIVSRYKVIENP